MISRSHILRINSAGYGTHKNLEHISAEILSEYKAIIIDPVSPHHIMPSLSLHTNITTQRITDIISSGHYQYSSDADIRHFKTDLSERRRQLVKFFQKGGLLISFLRPLFSYADGNYLKMTNYQWFPYPFDNFLTLSAICKGKEVLLLDRGSESSFAQYLKLKNLVWRTCVEAFNEKTKKVSSILAVNQENKSVSFTINLHNGKAVFLPICSLFTETEDKLLMECINDEYSRMTLSDEPPDPWVNSYYIPSMLELEEEVNDFCGKVERLKQDMATKEQELKSIKSYRDVLLNKKGHLLQDKVIQVLREIGIDAKSGPEGRDDIIINDCDRIVAVCEVKGNKKSAAERDAAQLMKWVARVLGEEGYEPKGILIVNAFCEKDVLQRTEDAFPHQMLELCIRHKYCLLTTTQLFNIFCDFKRGKIPNGNTILKEWLACEGTYDKYTDITCNIIEKNEDS